MEVKFNFRRFYPLNPYKLEKKLNHWEINPCSRVKQLVDGLKV